MVEDEEIDAMLRSAGYAAGGVGSSAELSSLDEKFEAYLNQPLSSPSGSHRSQYSHASSSARSGAGRSVGGSSVRQSQVR